MTTADRTPTQDTEVRDRYARVAGGFGSRLQAVRPNQWRMSTPCTDWTVRDLALHVIGTHWRIIARLNDTEPVEADSAGDLVGQWRAARGEIERALDDPERASTTMSGMFGDRPFSSLVGGLLCADALAHTWDLARATGQDEQLDPESVSKAFEFIQPLDERVRVTGGFGPKIEAGPDADEQTRFLNFCGRRV